MVSRTGAWRAGVAACFLAAIPSSALAAPSGRILPANDECAGAIPVFDGLNPGLTNAGATDSLGAATACPGDPMNSDVWYAYTATCTGPAIFMTCGVGTLTDPVLAVYDGTGGCGALAFVGCNDDACLTRSFVTLPVAAGTVYYIRIGDFGTSVFTGTFELTITCSPAAPPNDECPGAIPVFDGLNPGLSSVGATDSPGLGFACPPVPMNSDVWYVYTASCTSVATFETCGPGSLLDGVVVVYDGSGGCGALFPLACNDDSCGTDSLVSVPVTTGTVYYVQVADWGASVAQGTFDLTITCIPPVPNDECTGAIPIAEGTTAGLSSVGATTSSAWPCGTGGSDVWFSTTASCTGDLVVATCAGATYDTTVEVFDGSAGCFLLGSLGCSDDLCGLRSGVCVPVSAGMPYFIRVGGFGGAAGTFALSLTCFPGGPPANDECAGATPVLTGLNGPISTVCATTSAESWTCGGVAPGKDLWFSYTATCTGTALFTTCGPLGAADYDSVVEIFDGTGVCGFLSPVGCNDDACGLGSGSTVSIPVVAGAPYYVRVGGFGGDAGNFSLFISNTSGGGSYAGNPTGCGGLVLTAANNPTLGATVTFTLSGLSGAGSLIWFGGSTGPGGIPLCLPASCALGAALGLILPGPSIPATVPCTPSLIGGMISVQGGDILGAGGCGLAPFGFPFTVSNTINVTIG